MKQTDFYYAHLDLMVTEGGASYLGEINLRGGLRGARISPQDYRQRIKAADVPGRSAGDDGPQINSDGPLDLVRPE